MKVLHLSSERTWRGGEQQIAYLIEESMKYGIKCYVACRRKSSFEKWVLDNKIEHISLGFNNELDVITANKIKRYCSLHSIDIVHMHSSHSQAMGVISSILGNKSLLVLSRRVDFPIRNSVFSRFKFNFRGIRRIISVSHKIEEVLSRDIKNKSIMRTVHSGIDLDRFMGNKKSDILHSEFGLDPDYKLVANISALSPHKDYPTFVQTAQQILSQTSKVHFFIIGNGPCRDEIEEMISQKGLDKHISITGFRKDIPEIIKEIDVFLMTSATEGLGTTLLDAFANYVPVVATNGGGIPELILDGETGMLSDVGDFEELAKNVLLVLNNDKLSKELCKNAYDHLMENFTIERMAIGNISIYEELLSETLKES